VLGAGAAGAAGAGALLAACGATGGGGEQTSKAAAPYTLVWGVRTSATPEAVQAALREFGAIRPNVTVERFDAAGGIDQIMEKLTTGLAGGVPLDVVMGPVTARMFVETLNVLTPLEDLARKDRFDFGKYSKDVLDSVARYNGKVYALPYGYGANLMAVIYNRSAFASAGVPLPPADWAKPWTWDTYRDSLRKLTRSEDGKQVRVGATQFGNWVTSVPVQWDTSWISADFKTALSDTAPMLDAYTRFNDLLMRDRVFGNSPGADLGAGDAFLNGKAAVQVLGAAPLGYVRRIQGIDWAFTTMPKGRTASADITAVVLGLAKSAKNPQEAWEFLKFLDDRSRMATLDERVPTILSDAANWTKENFAQWPDCNANTLIEGIKVARPQEPAIRHPQWAKMASEVFTPGWSDILAQRKAMVEVLKEAKPRLQQILDDHARKVGQAKLG
jgi:multiple sugar transport system substrate-binding protein